MDNILLGSAGILVAASIGTLWRLVLMKADKADMKEALSQKANKEVVEAHTEMFRESLSRVEEAITDLASKSESRQSQIWDELRKMNGGGHE